MFDAIVNDIKYVEVASGVAKFVSPSKGHAAKTMADWVVCAGCRRGRSEDFWRASPFQKIMWFYKPGFSEFVFVEGCMFRDPPHPPLES